MSRAAKRKQSREPEFRNPKPETRNPKPETRNLQLEPGTGMLSELKTPQP